jgi:hypothetical protein
MGAYAVAVNTKWRRAWARRLRQDSSVCTVQRGRQAFNKEKKREMPARSPAEQQYRQSDITTLSVRKREHERGSRRMYMQGTVSWACCISVILRAARACVEAEGAKNHGQEAERAMGNLGTRSKCAIRAFQRWHDRAGA